MTDKNTKKRKEGDEESEMDTDSESESESQVQYADESCEDDSDRDLLHPSSAWQEEMLDRIQTDVDDAMGVEGKKGSEDEEDKECDKWEEYYSDTKE